jgi:tetratricopeptide (TPR) repeat protein
LVKATRFGSCSPLSKVLLAALSIAALCTAACAGGPSGSASTIAPPPPTPTVVTNATYGDALRRFQAMPVSDKGRLTLRDRLVEHLIAKGPDETSEAADDKYAALVGHLYAVTSLYLPEELEQNLLPPGLDGTARALYKAGSPRGDEARVLAALLVLRSLHPKDAESAQMYEKIKEWSFESRAALSGPLERFQEGLIDAWEEHARLTPTPEVLRTLSRLYIEHRDELVRLYSAGRLMHESAFEGVQNTAISIAGVYLRQGQVNAALSHVQALGSLAGSEARFTERLEASQEESADGALALLDLIRIYYEGGALDIANGIALAGLRQRPYEPAFAVRLGRIAAESGDFEAAMGWYAEAVRLAPDERIVYDEILDVLNGKMEQGLFGADVEQTRAIGNRAAQILEQRMTRWPDPPPPVKPDELYLALGVAEMNAGHPDEAERRLRAGLAAQESVAAHLQLGFLLGRIGRSKDSAGSYQRALELIAARESDPDPPRRAEVLESLGDAQRLSGDTAQANASYEKALAVWDANLARLRGQRLGIAQLRRGVLLGRLHRSQETRAAFEKALELAPDVRETYASILVHLLVNEPDAVFAHRVFRQAQNQMSLAPEWKVYFALWLQAIAHRSRAAIEPDVQQILAELAAGTDWFAKLAQFASGKLAFDALYAAGKDIGQHTEAQFYESMRRLGTGDTAGAREMLQRVLQGQMVSFYEYAIAQELLALPVASTQLTQAP